MSLVDRLLALANAVGVDIKSIFTAISDEETRAREAEELLATNSDSMQMDRTNLVIKESANMMKMHTTMLNFVTSTSKKV